MQDESCTRISLAELSDLRRSSACGNWWLEDHGKVWLQGSGAAGTLLLMHGAGAGQASDFLVAWRDALATQGVQTLAVEFSYMQRMQEEGRRRPPPKVSVLVEELRQWHALLSRTEGKPLWLGGKSMGGRVASMLVAEGGPHGEIPGLVLAGYPFHPVGKPDRLRLEHWPGLHCPTLVLQGTRDPFGTQAEVEGYGLTGLASRSLVHWLEDGDHDWVARRASGTTQQGLIEEAAKVTAQFMLGHKLCSDDSL